MLFWSPSCGFCQQMLDDLKKWEDSRRGMDQSLWLSPPAPLTKIASKDFARACLLDPYYAASQVFNSGGTPSAVMVDQGRVASSVAVGAQAVLALAGAVPASKHQPPKSDGRAFPRASPVCFEVIHVIRVS